MVRTVASPVGVENEHKYHTYHINHIIHNHPGQKRLQSPRMSCPESSLLMSFHPRRSRRGDEDDFEQLLKEQAQFQQDVAAEKIEPAAMIIKDPKKVRAAREAREAKALADQGGTDGAAARSNHVRSGHPLGVSSAAGETGVAEFGTTQDGRDVVSLGSAELPSTQSLEGIEASLRQQEAAKPKGSRFKQRKEAAAAAAAAASPAAPQEASSKEGFDLLNAHEVRIAVLFTVRC